MTKTWKMKNNKEEVNWLIIISNVCFNNRLSGLFPGYPNVALLYRMVFFYYYIVLLLFTHNNLCFTILL